MKKKTILFMGTGDIALPSFKSLIESDYDILGLFTQPDRPVGRKQVLTPPAIKVMAEEEGIPVWQPERLRGSEEIEVIQELAPDVIVVMAYGQILPKSVIDAPGLACINLHGSLLPKYRGASCVQGPIADGDAKTGITVMHVAPALDEGDMILQHSLDLLPEHTGGVVHDLLAEIAPGALIEGLAKLFSNTAERIVQDDALSCYAPKLLRVDGVIDWSVDADALERKVRAYDPWPGTSTSFIDDKGRTKKLKIFPPIEVHELEEASEVEDGEVVELTKEGLVVACGGRAVRISHLQPEGSARQTAQQFANGAKLSAGQKLG